MAHVPGLNNMADVPSINNMAGVHTVNNMVDVPIVNNMADGISIGSTSAEDASLAWRRQLEQQLRRHRRAVVSDRSRAGLHPGQHALPSPGELQRWPGTDNTPLTTAALRLLKRGLAAGPELRDAFSQSHLLQRKLHLLVSALTGDDPQLQLESAGCLTNWAAGTVSTDAVRTTGPYLVTLASGGNHVLQGQCVWTLGNMCCSGSAVCSVLAMQGLQAVTLTCLSSPHQEVQDSAAVAAAAFITYAPEQDARTLARRVLPLLPALLSLESPLLCLCAAASADAVAAATADAVAAATADATADAIAAATADATVDAVAASAIDSEQRTDASATYTSAQLSRAADVSATYTAAQLSRPADVSATYTDAQLSGADASATYSSAQLSMAADVSADSDVVPPVLASSDVIMTAGGDEHRSSVSRASDAAAAAAAVVVESCVGVDSADMQSLLSAVSRLLLEGLTRDLAPPPAPVALLLRTLTSLSRLSSVVTSLLSQPDLVRVLTLLLQHRVSQLRRETLPLVANLLYGKVSAAGSSGGGGADVEEVEVRRDQVRRRLAPLLQTVYRDVAHRLT